MYESIPYPNFSTSDYVERKAKEFCTGQLLSIHYFDPKTNIEQLETEIYKFASKHDIVQFITYVIYHINKIVAEHISICTDPDTCQAVPESEDLLYYLYGRLREFGINVNINGFTKEEVYATESVIDEIIEQLEKFKSSQSGLLESTEVETIDAAIEDFSSLRGLQYIGKKKWFKLLYAFVAEYAATKLLDELFKLSIIPSIVVTLHFLGQKFLQVLLGI